MSRPDPRLLVPVSALPFVPRGALGWCCDHDTWHTPASMYSATHIDARAPELRDGLPVRLDALPWLLKVLHPKATQIEGHALAQFPGVVLLSIENGVMVHWREYTKHRGTWSGTYVLNPWPDLTGLTPDEAARAVVVAAVVARGAK